MKAKKQKIPSTGCPYYNQNNMDMYKDSVAAQIHDMEQLLTLGKELKACPYYSTRYAIPGAQVRGCFGSDIEYTATCCV